MTEWRLTETAGLGAYSARGRYVYVRVQVASLERLLLLATDERLQKLLPYHHSPD
jgi:hypothetical protein